MSLTEATHLGLARGFVVVTRHRGAKHELQWSWWAMISITHLLTALRHYRRSLLELDALTDHDLRDLGVARDAISRVAWTEARRGCGLDKIRAKQPTDAALTPMAMTPR